MVRIGKRRIRGPGIPPSRRSRAGVKQALRDISKEFGIKGVHFVRLKRNRSRSIPYLGRYNPNKLRIIVVEYLGSQRIPMHVMVWNFFHELVHHIHSEDFLFAAYYYEAIANSKGKILKRYTLADARRVALRAERHADRKATELAWEFFRIGWVEPPAPYKKEDLMEARRDLFPTK